MAFKGMNPDEGRETATAVKEAGQSILDAIDTVTGIVNGVDWIGPDYESYKEDWNGFVTGAVSGVNDLLVQKGGELETHAEEQDTTSNNG